LLKFSGRFTFQGIYWHDGKGKIGKIYTVNDHLPKAIDETMIQDFYRYDSGAKEFKIIPGMKTIHHSTDAVTLHSSFYKRGLIPI